jgi:hypothetical protein
MKKYTVNVHDDGTKEWFLNGIRHREDGPAIESGDYQKWYLNGQFHRVGGPAIIHTNGNKSWYLNGVRHREDGPAVESSGDKFWYLNGKLFSEEEFHNLHTKELTVADIENF